MKLSQKAKYTIWLYISNILKFQFEKIYTLKNSASKQGKQASNFIILKFLTKTTLVTYFVVNGVKELIVKAKEFTR